MQLISDDQRRVRLGVRHALAARVGTVPEAIESVVCLHATEPPSVYLSAAARAEVTERDLHRALFEQRSVVRQLAMRRTLFVFPRDLLPAVWGSAAARVATQQTTRLAKEVEANGIAKRGDAWVRRTSEAVLRSLAEDGPATTMELRQRLPPLDRRVEMHPDKAYGGVFPVGPRLLTALGASGRILRGENTTDWRVLRPRWTLAEDWLGGPVTPLDAADGYRELVRRWLARFGPGTETDLVWWLGATKSAVRRALAELGAVEVGLSSGLGYVLPGDEEDLPSPEPWAALLPVLDPTTMGWKQRDFYLDAVHVPHLFDTNGNGGSTAWWGGRVVGCWVQDPDGVVSVVHLGDTGSEARAALDLEAERLTSWLAGVRISSVYTSTLMKSGRTG